MASVPCFDAGSVYCPCHLAYLGSCVACSVIRGESNCDCGWSGLCVYREFTQRKSAVRPRRAHALAVLERTDITPSGGGGGTFIVTLEAGKDLSAWCLLPGSFLMVRPSGSPARYAVPVSVMRASHDRIWLAIEPVGPKTVTLTRHCAPGKKVTVTGPYWSGLQGGALLREHAPGHVLIVAKGIGQAPAVNIASYILSLGGKVKALLGPGVTGVIFADKLLADAGAIVRVLPKTIDHNIGEIQNELMEESYDLLISEGSDLQHRALLEACVVSDNPPLFAWSSNLKMTCAEGICGSCLVNGRRGCKGAVDRKAALGLI